jgi:hypothetical protein
VRERKDAHRTREAGHLDEIQTMARFVFISAFIIETPSRPALTRRCPHGFTFYVAHPVRSVHPSTLPRSGLPLA